MTNQIAPKWKEIYDILDPEDVQDLEMRAAINQYHHNIPRHEAEDRAHKDYKKDKVIESAVHHLKGLMSAHHIGDKEVAQKHGILYKLAMDELGHKDLLNPPEEIAKKLGNTKEELHKFKAHKGDYYLVNKEQEKDQSS